jgi:hypothetical protein
VALASLASLANLVESGTVEESGTTQGENFIALVPSPEWRVPHMNALAPPRFAGAANSGGG